MCSYASLVGALGVAILVLRPVPGDASVGAQVGAALVGSLEFLACFVGSFVGAMLAAGIFSAANISMSWYARPGLIVLMYGAPSLGGECSCGVPVGARCRSWRAHGAHHRVALVLAAVTL